MFTHFPNDTNDIGNTEVPNFRTGLEFVILENCYPRILPCYICSILTTGLILIIEFGKFTSWNFI